MEGSMKVAVMTQLGKIEMQRRPIPSPNKGEVLVKIEYVGVCGSDLHYFEKGRIGDFVVKFPFVLGHECSGTVVGLGDGVKGLKTGDRVAIEPGIVCGTCKYCKSGRYNLCHDMQKTVFLSTHDVEIAIQMADSCWVMGGGGLHIGTPRELAEQGIISRFVERPGVVFDKENLSIRIQSM